MNTFMDKGEMVFAWVVQTTWQAGVLALVILAVQMAFRRRLSPAWRYGLWLLLVARLLLPASLPAAWSLYNVAPVPRALKEWPPMVDPGSFPVDFPLAPKNPADMVSFPGDHFLKTPAQAAQIYPAPGSAKPGQSRVPWRKLPFYIWLLGMGVFALRLGWSNVSFVFRVRRTALPASGAILDVMPVCQKTMDVKGRVEVKETPVVQSPAVYGLWRKRLLLPPRVGTRFSKTEMRCIILHELAHIKRRDLEVNWLTSLLLVVHWFNPLLWLAFARMRHDREMACDALALTRLGASQLETYGETIIKVACNLMEPARVTGMLALSENKQNLKERIRAIAAFRMGSRWPMLAIFLVLVLAGVGLTNASRIRAGIPEMQPADSVSDKEATENKIILSRGIHVKVVDTHGLPVSNASVTCVGYSWHVETDALGRFSWVGEKGPREFSISKTGYKTRITPPLDPGTQEFPFMLPTAPVIRGKVVDRDTRQPISRFDVYRACLIQGPVVPRIRPEDKAAGSSGVFVYSFTHGLYPDDAFCIQAEGYLPKISSCLTAEDYGSEMTFELTRAEPIKGQILTAEGLPVAKAEVRLWRGEFNIRDIPNRLVTESEKDGTFSLPAVLDGVILVNHNEGYAEIPWKEFLSNQTVRLSHWIKVKGHWPKPLPPSRKVMLERVNWTDQIFTFPPRLIVPEAEISGDGSFEFHAVPPGEYTLKEWVELRVNSLDGEYSMLVLDSKRMHVLIEPGATANIEVPDGRPVVGKLDFSQKYIPTNYHLPIVSLRLKQAQPKFQYPTLDETVSDASRFTNLKEYRDRLLTFWLSPEGMAQRRAERVFETHAEPDGTFRIEHVMPGIYELHVNPSNMLGTRVATMSQEITIPLSSDKTPIELGPLK